MIDRDQYSTPDLSPQSRLGEGLPVSIAKGTNISDHASKIETRKRKRGDLGAQRLLGDPFVIKPHPSTITTKPRSLTPIALISRASLPLSCLDTRSSTTGLPESRYFEAQIKVLDLEARIGSTSMILLAKLDDNRSVYAVERVEPGLYVLCKLGSWVDLLSFAQSASAFNQDAVLLKTNTSNWNPETRLASFEKGSESNGIKHSKRKGLAIEAIRSLVNNSSRDSQPTSPADFAFPDSGVDAQLVSPAVDSVAVESDSHASAGIKTEDILENIKASLGYFAKGPLSKARAAYQLGCDGSFNIQELIDFLQCIILSANVMDKKYKEGLPKALSSLDAGSASSKEMMERNKKKRKSTKLSKEGLYALEDSYIRQWWENGDDEAGGEDTSLAHDDRRRVRIVRLKNRETQLQIIVLLEIVALQKLLPKQTDNPPRIGTDNVEGKSKDGSAKAKAKKMLDFDALLDIHIDRLCIWQSVAMEDKTVSTPGLNATTKQDVPAKQAHSTDVLREFCTEVIIPFFSSRLPHQCKAISKKLGGPAASSRTRPRLVKSASTSTPSTQPAAMIGNSVSSTKPSRTLKRILTDERNERSVSRGSPGAISLMRSATAPVIPGLKREDSTGPSPGGDMCADLPNHRRGLLQSSKFSQREVDLSNPVSTSEVKHKKPDIEAELRDAITALKRPNRLLAGKTMMETAESRAAVASQLRKCKKPVRSQSFQPVQIMATPKTRRHKNALAVVHATPSRYFDELDPDSHEMPTSSALHIPQSTHKHKSSSSTDAFLNETPDRDSTIFITPSKPTSSSLGELFLHPPLQPRNTNLQQRLLAVPTARSGRDNVINVFTPDLPRKPDDFCLATPQKTGVADRVTGEWICPDTLDKRHFHQQNPAETIQSSPAFASTGRMPEGDEGGGKEGGEEEGGGQSGNTAALSDCIGHGVGNGSGIRNDRISNGNGAGNGTANGDGIYEALGWDDDDDL